MDVTNIDETAGTIASAQAQELSIEAFASLLGQKPAFQEKVILQALKDISILKQLGMNDYEIRTALGLAKKRDKVKKAGASVLPASLARDRKKKEGAAA